MYVSAATTLNAQEAIQVVLLVSAATTLNVRHIKPHLNVRTQEAIKVVLLVSAAESVSRLSPPPPRFRFGWASSETPPSIPHNAAGPGQPASPPRSESGKGGTLFRVRLPPPLPHAPAGAAAAGCRSLFAAHL